jgi:DNA polymerase-3 subunit gamma/tau
MTHVIYRKYRPANFDEVIGQEHVTEVLKDQIKGNKLGHAYLFSGSRGTGKTSVARIFANEINGYRNNEETLDIIEIDAASNRGIDDIRDLRDKITYAPSKSNYKVYIIDEVHMLTKEAFNALLKTLEEPPKHVIFIFATTEPHKVPITILSRVTRFDFKLATYDSLKRKFEHVLTKEKIKFTSEALDLIIKYSNGSFRDGESLLTKLISSLDKKQLDVNVINKIIGFVDKEVVHGFIELILTNKTLELIKFFNALKAEGKNLDIIIQQLIIEFENLLVNQLDRSNVTVRVEIPKLISIINELCKAINDSKGDIFYGLSYELALIKITNINDPLPNTPPNKITTEKIGIKDKLEQRIEKQTDNLKVKENEGESSNLVSTTEILVEEIVAETTINITELESKWKLFIKSLAEENFQLAALLVNTKLSHSKENSIIVEVPYSYYKTKLETKDFRFIIENYLKKESGNTKLKITIQHNPGLQKKDNNSKEKGVNSNKEIVEEVFNV